MGESIKISKRFAVRLGGCFGSFRFSPAIPSFKETNMSDDETLAIADPSLLDWYASGSEDIHAFNRACIAFAHAIAAKER